jgi:hypothetical protein
MGTKEQVYDLFRSEGMTPKEVSYDSFLDMYRVRIDTEGTEDRFIESYSGPGGPGSQYIDTDELKRAKARIQFSEIPDGTVVVRNKMIDSHFRIEVF